MGDPPMKLPGIDDEWRLWDQVVGSQLHVHSLRRVTCENHLESMSHTDRCARIVKTYLDRNECSTELAFAYCSGHVTTEHITMMERRARIRQTSPRVSCMNLGCSVCTGDPRNQDSNYVIALGL
eukprot:5135805-Karenia_brevis.AAC.1